jgi:hypothetical protein
VLIYEYKNDLNLDAELRQIIETVLASDDQDLLIRIELGPTLFYTVGPSFHNNIESSLRNTMKVEFFEILGSHSAERKQGDKVSLLD